MSNMAMVAIGIFAADVGAVALIAGSLIFERWLGLGRGVALDAILLLAAGYAAGAWELGRIARRVIG
jgi:hypothetical protein